MTAAPYGCVSVAEAARRRGVTRQAIDSLIKRGRLAATHDGARYWVAASDLDALATPPEGSITVEEIIRISRTCRLTVDRARLPHVKVLGRNYYEREPALAWAKNVAPTLRRRRGHNFSRG